MEEALSEGRAAVGIAADNKHVHHHGHAREHQLQGCDRGVK